MLRSPVTVMLLATAALAGFAQAATLTDTEYRPSSTLEIASPIEPLLTGPSYLFDTGTPRTDPNDASGACTAPCFPWSSTFYNSPANYDLTARQFTVPIGSVATAFRGWWAYGNSRAATFCVDQGGGPADFTSYGMDVYADSGFGPGALVASLTGTLVTLNPATHYRELQLSSPYVFGAGSYYAVFRANTATPDYGAVMLWMSCAPNNTALDYETVSATCQTGFPWTAYPIIPGSPCPGVQFNFGLQVVGYPSPDQVQMDADNDCVSSVDPCVNVSFDFIRGDTTPARLVSTTFQLSSNLELCGSLGSSIHNVNGTGGAWLGAGFNGNFNAYVDGPGTYTVDVAVLGLPCGPTNSGTLFTVDVKKTTGFPDGTGTITITNVVVRDCLNAPLPGSPGAAASLTLDAAGPSSIANLAAPQRKTGNAAGSTTDIQVNFTAPGDASVVEVYRAPFGNYPEYDDPPTPGSVPSAPPYPPGSPWTLTAVTTSGQYDHPSTRDFWYYVVFTKDACGNVSSVSNRTGGTLNYHLGDVSNGGTPCLGDNFVNTADISLLGAHYGIPVPSGFECLDVGPTTDFSINARPTTDNLIGFEDLILFAINYGAVSFTNEQTVESASATAPRLRFVLDPVQVAGRQSGRLFLDGNDARVKGVHAGLRFDPLAVTGLEVVAGSLLEAQSSEFFFRTPSEPKLLWIDAVVLGTDRTMHGSGEIARVSWSSSSPRVRPELAGFDLRDRDNRSLTSTAGATSRAAERPNLLDRSTPSVSGLESVRWLGARPNPFPRSTELHFALGASAEVDVTIFDLAGRRVRSLSSGPMDAGDHMLTWDGRDDQGRATGAAVYLVRLTAGGQVESHKLYRYR